MKVSKGQLALNAGENEMCFADVKRRPRRGKEPSVSRAGTVRMGRGSCCSTFSLKSFMCLTELEVCRLGSGAKVLVDGDGI